MIKTEDARKHSTSSTSTSVKHEDQDERGRNQVREGSEVDKTGDVHSEDEQKETAGKGKGERKRKRSRKGLDKKYLCPQEGCGKSYSRAEHLYRHQLNRGRDTAAGIRDIANAEFQTPQSRFTNVTIPTVSALLSDKIFAPAIAKGTPPEGHTSNGRITTLSIPSSMAPYPNLTHPAIGLFHPCLPGISPSMLALSISNPTNFNQVSCNRPQLSRHFLGIRIHRTRCTPPINFAHSTLSNHRPAPAISTPPDFIGPIAIVNTLVTQAAGYTSHPTRAGKAPPASSRTGTRASAL